MNWLPICLAFFMMTPLYGQSDSLRLELSKEFDIDRRIDILTQLAYEYLKSDNTQSGQYALEALELSHESKDRKRIAAAQNSVANYYARSGKFDQSLADSLYVLALENAETLDDTFMLKTIYNNLGIQAKNRGERPEALDWFHKALSMDPDTSDLSAFSRTLRNIGIVYDLLEQFEQAETYFEDAVNTAQKGDDQFEKAEALNSLAITKSKQGQVREGLRIFKDALSIYQPQNKVESTINVLNNICYSYQVMNELDSALSYMRFIESQIKSTHEDGMKMRIMVTKAEILVKQNRLDDAITELKNALKIAPKSGDLHHHMGIYRVLSEVYQKKGAFEEALLFTTRYHAFKDSVNRIESVAQMNELELKYQTAKKDQRIQSQNLLLARRGHSQNLLIFLSIVLAIAAIGIFLWFQDRLKIRKEIDHQKRLIQQQKIDALEKQQRMMTMNGMIKGQEDERQRIAQDLHDGLGGLLSTIKTHFQSLKPNLGNSEMSLKTETLIDRAYQEVSRVSYDLMPSALSSHGLADAITDLAATMKQVHGIEMKVNIEGLTHRLDETREKVIFRMIQELTTNIIKHARAKTGFIQIVKRGDEILILIEDDGSGFDQQKARLNGGIGLKGLQSRVDYLGGDLSIDSVIGEGTTTSIQITLNK